MATHTREQTAFHEAAHAVVAHALGTGVLGIEMEDTPSTPGFYAGCTHFDRNLYSSPNGITIASAGHAVEELIAGRTLCLNDTGSGMDYEMAVMASLSLASQGLVFSLEEAMTEAKVLILAAWDRIERVAKALLESVRLTGEKFLSILEESLGE